MKKRVINVLLIMVLLLNSVIAFGDNYSDKQKKLSDTNKKINNLQKEIKKNNLKVKDIEKEIKAFDAKMDKADTELMVVEEELKDVNGDISNTEKELESAENNIELKEDTMGKRLRVMYKSGPIGYIELIFSSESLSDLFSRIDLIKRIIKQDKELLKYMQEQREIVKERKEKLEQQKIELFNVKKEMDKKRDILLTASRSKERLMRQLRKDTGEMERQYKEYTKLAQNISSDIRSMQGKGKYTGGRMAWPSPGYYRINSPFGYRIHPISKTRKLHTGVDIGAPSGATSVAPNDGTVIYSDWRGGYGKTVMIDHGGGIVTLFAHNSRLLVKKGEKVKKGQAIAKVGSTGYSTGPHMHFEVRKNGDFVNPMDWVTKQ